MCLILKLGEKKIITLVLNLLSVSTFMWCRTVISIHPKPGSQFLRMLIILSKPISRKDILQTRLKRCKWKTMPKILIIFIITHPLDKWRLQIKCNLVCDSAATFQLFCLGFFLATLQGWSNRLYRNVKAASSSRLHTICYRHLTVRLHPCADANCLFPCGLLSKKLTGHG